MGGLPPISLNRWLVFVTCSKLCLPFSVVKSGNRSRPCTTTDNDVRQFNQQLIIDTDSMLYHCIVKTRTETRNSLGLLVCCVLCVWHLSSYDVGALSSTADENCCASLRCRSCSAVAAASATSQTCSHRPQVSTGNLTSTCQGRFTLTATPVAVPACLFVS